MASEEGQAKDLNQGSNNALLDLLRSIAPGVVPEDKKKLSEDDVKRINEKLTELLGKDVVEQYNQNGNEPGELVNEEGLPIIDVTEPTEIADFRATATALAAEEDRLVLLTSLPLAERERLRQERDHILDLLEEEERLEEQCEKQRFIEEKEEFIRKKMEEGMKEKDRAKSSKEMQTKMGKALLGNADKPKSGDDALPSEPSRTKKTVSFALDPVKANASEQDKLGDISLATLRKTNRPTLVAAAGREDDKLPMKINVVERKPVGQNNLQTKLQYSADSDDESNLDEDEGEKEGEAQIGTPPLPEDSASESDATDSSLEDFDYAQHQREIAIEYYNKRGMIGQAAAQEMVSHSHDNDEEKREIPPDVGVTEPHSKPSISHFKASNLASSYNASLPPKSKSLEGSLLSASTAKTLQRAIRMGKLDSQGRLIEADDESESEPENETLQDVLELLKKGEVLNVGPKGDQVLFTVPSPGTSLAVDAGSLSPLSKPKTSKFKVDRSQAGPSKAGQKRTNSVSTDSKHSTMQPTMPAVIERLPPGSVSANSTLPMTPAIGPPSLPSPMSAPKPSSGPFQPPHSIPQSLATDSPSFRPPNGGPSPFSMIIDSPSFPPPRSTTKPKPITTPISSSTARTSSSLGPAAAPRRPTRPPVVMSSVVRETSSQTSTEKVDQPDKTNPPKSKRVSRFLAERI